MWRRARSVMRVRDGFRQRAQGSPKALALVDEVLRAPYMTVTEAQRTFGVTDPTARTAVLTPVEALLLEEVGEHSWRRLLYAAWPVLDVPRDPSSGT